MNNIEIVYAGDSYYARGHHEDGAFWDAMLKKGLIAMDTLWRGYWRWGFGDGEYGRAMVAYGYSDSGRGRFPVTVTEFVLKAYRQGDPLTHLADRNYRHAMKELSRLVVIDPKPNSPEGRRILALSDLIGQYESVHFPIGKGD